jgi:hypothetical protein
MHIYALPTSILSFQSVFATPKLVKPGHHSLLAYFEQLPAELRLYHTLVYILPYNLYT